MKRIAYLQKHDQITPLWGALVAYANDTPDDDVFENFWAMICRGLDWIDAVEHPLESYEEAIGSCRDATVGASHQEMANLYRPDVRNVLAWLSAPGTVSKDDGYRAGLFLSKLSADMAVLVAANHEFSSKGKRSKQNLILKMPSNIGSVLTGVSRFILDQVDRHDVYGEPLSKVIPIGFCARPGCGRFLIVERTGRAKFCSANCRAKNAKSKKPAAEHAAYMKSYRALKAERESKRTSKARAK